MYRVYASDPQARINLGIRRRLAPLMGNDRRRIELMNALLFSLPGTPVVYYGDEIGMGDNIYLGDRNGVRTPMQWSPDRNAGFSQSNPQKLYSPGHHRPGVPLRGVERRRPAEQSPLAALVDEAHHRAPAAVSGVRPGQPALPAPGQRPGARLRPRVRGRADPGGGQPLALRPGGRARPGRVPGHHADRDVRADPVPPDPGRPLRRDPEPLRLLLVHAPGGHGRRPAGDGRVQGAGGEVQRQLGRAGPGRRAGGAGGPPADLSPRQPLVPRQGQADHLGRRGAVDPDPGGQPRRAGDAGGGALPRRRSGAVRPAARVRRGRPRPGDHRQHAQRGHPVARRRGRALRRHRRRGLHQHAGGRHGPQPPLARGPRRGGRQPHPCLRPAARRRAGAARLAAARRADRTPR